MLHPIQRGWIDERDDSGEPSDEYRAVAVVVNFPDPRPDGAFVTGSTATPAADPFSGGCCSMCGTRCDQQQCSAEDDGMNYKAAH